jgi:hypothetical protein
MTLVWNSCNFQFRNLIVFFRGTVGAKILTFPNLHFSL